MILATMMTLVEDYKREFAHIDALRALHASHEVDKQLQRRHDDVRAEQIAELHAFRPSPLVDKASIPRHRRRRFRNRFRCGDGGRVGKTSVRTS